MQASKADIIAQLQKQLAPLQGLKPALNGIGVEVEPGPRKIVFPNDVFAFGAIHEFLCSEREDAAATGGFISGVLATLMKDGGATIWINSHNMLFPPGLKTFGIEPEHVIFIDLEKPKDVLWAMEEALKCNGVAAVVGETSDLSFTASRRLQLAVEQSGVMGFVLLNKTRNLHTTAAVTRWQVRSLPGISDDKLPGVSFPRWNVSLLKIRNGKPATWQVEWRKGKFRPIPPLSPVIKTAFSKTG